MIAQRAVAVGEGVVDVVDKRDRDADQDAVRTQADVDGVDAALGRALISSPDGKEHQHRSHEAAARGAA